MAMSKRSNQRVDRAVSIMLPLLIIAAIMLALGMSVNSLYYWHISRPEASTEAEDNRSTKRTIVVDLYELERSQLRRWDRD